MEYVEWPAHVPKPMEKHTLPIFVDANIDDVFSVLKGHSGDLNDLDYGRGFIRLKMLAPFLVESPLTITGFFHWRDENDAKKISLIRMLRFELHRIRDNRTMLLACWVEIDQLQGFMANRLEYLAKAYPEVLPQLHDWLSSNSANLPQAIVGRIQKMSQLPVATRVVESTTEPKPKKKKGPPKLEEKDESELEERRKAVIEYLSQQEKLTKELAAKKVGHSRHSLETWSKHPLIGGKLDNNSGQ